MTSLDQPASPDVELRLPADGSFAFVLRATTAALTARLNFTVEEIEDTRIAVTEALALLLGSTGTATSPCEVRVGYALGDQRLVVSFSVPSEAGVAVDRASFGWQVLGALATDVTWDQAERESVLRLTMQSSVAA